MSVDTFSDVAVHFSFQLVQGKDDEIKRLREELNKTRQSYEDISSFCEESVSAVSRMEQKAEDLQVHSNSTTIFNTLRGLNSLGSFVLCHILQGRQLM